MIVLVQRVAEAKVSVDGRVVSEIGKGLLLLVGVLDGDSEKEIEYASRKCANLRIFDDEDGKMNLSALDIGGQMLCVSQFTLGARVRKGNRPSFDRAMKPPKSEELFDSFCSRLAGEGIAVQKGVFGAHMEVSLVNDGPVTIVIDSDEKR